MDMLALSSQFQRTGYVHVPGFADRSTLLALQAIANHFHHHWLQQNQPLFVAGAINSSGLTDGRYLNTQQRHTLFEFIGSNHLVKLVRAVLKKSSTFLNTQLFFDPATAQQANYWHRDPQYHLNEQQQQAALIHGPEVIHCRLALKPEYGVELIPGSHHQWDTEEERQIRLQLNGYQNHHALSNGVALPLAAGDLLVFSANMIHRGLYGLDRLALDIMFCEKTPVTLSFIDPQCLPNAENLIGIEAPCIFEPHDSITQTNTVKR